MARRDRRVVDNWLVSQPAAEPAGALATAQPPRRLWLFAALAVAVLAADVVTKTLAVAYLSGEPAVRLLGGSVYLVLFRNPGAAFSLATGMTWVLTLVAVGVVVVILRAASRLRSVGWAIALGLLLGGALGNLGDRLFRAPGPLQGHVVDFISLFAPDGSVWPVFNIADASICTGAALLILLALRGRELDGTRRTSRDEPATDSRAPGS
ncbi:MAG: signal peptidase II [Pseudonocardiales bacterium]|nr:signal peptidase II [Pseudonocardiales bacterium]